MNPPPEPTMVPNAPTPRPSRTSKTAIVGEKFTRSCLAECTGAARGSARSGGPFYDCGEPRSDLRRDRRKVVSADDREHALRVDGRDVRRLVTAVDDDVAREQRAELGLDRERAVRERRVARAEDEIWLLFDAELLVQSRLHVDLAEHTEALRL